MKCTATSTMRTGTKVILIVVDVHFDVGLHPIPIFPALAGYGTGLLMKMGGSLQLGFAIEVDLYLYVAITITFCIVYRHQTVMQPGNAFRIHKNTLLAAEVTIVIVAPIPAIVWAALSVSKDTTAVIDAIIDQDSHCIEWIRDRGYYYAEARSVFFTRFISILIIITILITMFVIAVFAHMFYALRQNSSKRSMNAMLLIKRSLINLLIQIGLPFFVFAVPAVVIMLGMLFENLFNFETLLISFLIMQLHSIGHNIVLLSINSTYRRYVLCKTEPTPVSSIF
ncbi:hypothetical protein PRIPAC_87635 [Pristionchus pacificus]|uniref:G protein-coupled receptor n=1 Tax=Pristionchus pacificus TaxID=54126 RepID=A0A2A6B5V5_PRIPA|nr:hypothetical protein PRIPAC_87635 [Pristionchus pacificus]|eukprot:PDM61264.1 G protein-coupled receptor [Pristionchus pacificus]